MVIFKISCNGWKEIVGEGMYLMTIFKINCNGWKEIIGEGIYLRQTEGEINKWQLVDIFVAQSIVINNTKLL